MRLPHVLCAVLVMVQASPLCSAGLHAATRSPSEGPRRGLRTADAGARDVRARAIVLAAEDERDARAPGLADLLDSEDPKLRILATRALGRIGDPASVPQLGRKLSDMDASVRREAAFALGQVASPSASGTLMAATLSDDPVLCGRAAEALSKLEWPSQDERHRVGALVMDRVLGTVPCCHGMAAGALASAARSSWRFGNGTTGLPEALTRLSHHEDLPVAMAAVYSASRLGDPSLEPMLSAACSGPSPALRSLGARGLARLVKPLTASADGAASIARLRSLVLPLAQDADEEVRINALLALAAFPAPEGGASAPLAGALSSSNHQVQRSALALVKAWKIAAAAEMLEQLIGGAERDVAVDAVLAIAAAKGAESLPLLAGVSTSQHWMLRASVAEALADESLASEQEARALLAALLVDEDPRVVATALDSAVQSKQPGVETSVLAHLEHPDVVVRAVAASLVPALVDQRLMHAEALVALRRAVAKAAGDRLTDARIGALEALVDVAGGEAEADLVAAMQDHEFTVRLKARELARKLGPSVEAVVPPAGLPGLGRPLAFYQEVVRRVELGPPRQLVLKTDRGDVVIDLFTHAAPLTCVQLGLLASDRFFDGLTFHRVVPDFVVQGGDPRGDGWGGPGQSLRCETHDGAYARGAVGMALSGKDTGGSQFFLTLAPQPHLEGRYTIFGQVRAESWEVMDSLRRFDVIRSARLVPEG